MNLQLRILYVQHQGNVSKVKENWGKDDKLSVGVISTSTYQKGKSNASDWLAGWEGAFKTICNVQFLILKECNVILKINTSPSLLISSKLFTSLVKCLLEHLQLKITRVIKFKNTSLMWWNPNKTLITQKEMNDHFNPFAFFRHFLSYYSYFCSFVGNAS